MKEDFIGLKRYTVKLKPYTEVWATIFIETNEKLQIILKDFDVKIEHVGSTSIVGLMAKPIIDIVIGISDISKINELITALEKDNYIYRGNSGENGGHLLVKQKAPEIRTHHIHIVERTDSQWENYLYFRDQLNSDIDLRKQYQNIKINLAERFINDRKSYTEGKSAFIKKILNDIK